MTLRHTHKLDLHPHGGVTIMEAAHDAYLIAREFGVEVDVIHNDRRYKISLEVKEDVELRDAGA